MTLLFVESYMSDDRTTRINAAIDECLDRCSKSSTPPGITLQGFCAELHEQGWSDEDIKVVQTTAARIVRQQPE